MRKPIKLTSTNGTFSVNFDNGQTTKKELVVSNKVLDFQVSFDSNQFSNKETQLSEGDVEVQTSFDSEQAMSEEVEISSNTTDVDVEFDKVHLVTQPNPLAPDWAENDSTAPGFIWNKQIAEQYRPIAVNGKEILNEKRSSGPLNMVSGDGIIITQKDNSVHFSAPLATLDRLGLVKSSKEKNQISVDESTGVMEVNSLSTDKLVQGELELILNGGNIIL